MFCRDGTNEDRWFLGAPHCFIAGGAMLLCVEDSDEPIWIVPDFARTQIARISPLPAVPPKRTKIRRPPNAYILYRTERHASVRDSNPGISNNEICMSFIPNF